jgi:altronate dehydratase small subunit
MSHALQIDPADNVAVLLAEVAKGTHVTVQTPEEPMIISSLDAIPFGHKIALQPIAKGGVVVKYGRPIGRATSEIPKGGLVGAHNIEGLRGRGDLAKEKGATL